MSRWAARQIPQPGERRLLGLVTLVNSLGNGLFMASSVLYFTRVVHLTAGQVGWGLSAAGLVALCAAVPAGDLADRCGPREVAMATFLLTAVTMASYLLVSGQRAFLVIACMDLIAASASDAARGGLIRRVGGASAAAFRSQLRAISNAGIAVGALAAGVAAQLDTPSAYRLLVLVNALTFLASAMICVRLPRYRPLPRPAKARRWAALSDLPFLAWTALNAAMSMQYFVLSLPLPIWIVSRTSAPRWTVAAVLGVNTLMCVLLQVRVGSRVGTVRQSGAALRVAGLMFLVSCAVLALVADVPGWFAAVLVLVAVLMHTWGELWHASASFTLGFALAPAHAQSQYQGLQAMGFGAGRAVAPALLTALCLGLGQAGWVLLGGLFLLIGLLAVPLTGWAERRNAALFDADGAEAVTAP